MRPRSSETRPRRPGAVALAAAAVAGLAIAVAVQGPASRATSTGDDAPRATYDPWLAVAHGEDVPVSDRRGPDPASIDPFANGAPASAATRAARPARLHLSVPATLNVGDMDDVVVSIDTPLRVSRLSFKVSMNADVLQARSVAQGDWIADPHASFNLDIAPNDDRVAVEATADPAGAGEPAGSVVRIRVQAMAGGTSQVSLSDIAATDDHGRPMAVVQIDAAASITALAPSPVTTADATRGRSARPVADLSESD